MSHKKWLPLLAAFIILFSQNAFASTFNDLGEYAWARNSIENMYANGYVSGFPDGTFRPESAITRAQFIAIINKMNGFEEEVAINFKDVNTKHWAYKEIRKAVAAGYINGFDDKTFRPDNQISKEQIAAMLNNLYHLENKELNQSIKDLNKISSWAVQAVVNVVSNKVMTLNSDQLFEGKKLANRAESIISLNQIIVLDVPTVEKWIVSQKVEEPTTNNNVGSIPPVQNVNEIDSKLTEVVSRMNSRVIPDLTTQLQMDAANIIINSINNYLNDSAYNTSSDVNYAKSLVGQMSNDEYIEFRNAITSNILIGDLQALNNVFNLIPY